MTNPYHSNKNSLMEYFFGECSKAETQKIQKHLEKCSSCQAYLLTLEQVDNTLMLLKDETPLPNTLETITANIRGREQKTREKSINLIITPFLKIVLTTFFIFGAILLLHDKIALLPFWHVLKNWYFFKLFGTIGAAVVVVFFLGTLISLALSPVLILDARGVKNRVNWV